VDGLRRSGGLAGLEKTSVPVTVIAAGRGGLWGTLLEAWQHRELLYFLAWRDVKVRYKQTVLGVLWAVLQPVGQMVIFTLVFAKGLGVQTDAAYPLFSFVALLPWTLFQNSLSRSSDSIAGAAHLLTKVYFPRLLVPLSSVVSGLVDFAISLVVLVIMLACYRQPLRLAALWLPAFVALAVLSALSVGIWLAALNAKYRDFRYVVPFMLTAWMFLSPVIYPATKITSHLPEDWRWLYHLNPMAGVIEGFRWALLGESAFSADMLLVSTGVVLVVFAAGLFYFRRMERVFADLL